MAPQLVLSRDPEIRRRQPPAEGAPASRGRNTDPDALSGMLKAIDAGGQGSVYVMQVEDGADIAGMGGLMGTAMFARGFAGAVIDGGVRDLNTKIKTFPNTLFVRGLGFKERDFFEVDDASSVAEPPKVQF